MKKLISIILFLLNFSLAAQQDTVFFSAILEEVLFSKEDVIFYENIYISNENLKFKPVSEYLRDKYHNLQVDSLGKVVISRQIVLDNVTGLIQFANLAFNEKLVISTAAIDAIVITNSTFNLGLNISATFHSSNYPPGLVFYDNDIHPSDNNKIQINGGYLISIGNNRFKGSSESEFTFSDWTVDNVEIRNNTFDSVNFSFKNSTLGNLDIIKNSFKNACNFDENTITDRVIILHNTFNRFALSKTLLPELYVNIDWEQLKGNKLFINTAQTPEENKDGYHCSTCLPYYGRSDEELFRRDRFRELVSVYTKLYRINKEDGDINSANGAYAELQELYTRRYGYLTRTVGGIENWFKWRLNQLLEFYVVYGTAPARALVVSFYIILTFSIFYFFFPSEWDVASKKQLLEQFKLTLDKEHKQTGRPLMNTLGLFILSFINAFTLSINSFVTLGFGTIPTKGIARYVCIIEGFIGWFLLSLFTVALINQVIF